MRSLRLFFSCVATLLVWTPLLQMAERTNTGWTSYTSMQTGRAGGLDSNRSSPTVSVRQQWSGARRETRRVNDEGRPRPLAGATVEGLWGPGSQCARNGSLMRRLHLLVGDLVLVGAVLFASAGDAWGRSKLDGLERSAKKACAAGDYAKGVDILADLYVRTDDPTFIFNQGRCYEQNHQWVRAIDRFREYLVKAGNSEHDAAAEAEKHIDKCKTYLSEDEAKAISPPSAQPQTTVAVQPVPPPPPTYTPEVTTNTVITASSPPQAGTSSVLPTVGIVLGSIGLASLTTAIVLNIKTNDYANTGDESNMKSYRNGALVCYGVGGAALVTGIVLYVVGHSSNVKTNRVALLPTWTHDGAGLSLEGRF
jgi:hypothetical protein